MALGTTQTLAWASSYYLPAILGAPIAAALGLPASIFFRHLLGLAPARRGDQPLGRAADRRPGWARRTHRVERGAGHGARAPRSGPGHCQPGQSPGPSSASAWAIGLYDPAFATLTRLYGHGARAPITGITLIAGFASTVGWPASAWFEHAFGWREACLIWAGLRFLALPLNWLVIPPVAGAKAAVAAAVKPHIPLDRTMILLAFAFAAAWSVTGAMAAHLPRILESAGATSLQAVAAGALIGPAQVAARVFEASIPSAAIIPCSRAGWHV